MLVRKSVAWAFTGQFVSFATGLATSIIIARLLTPHEMGIYAVAFAMLGTLQVATAFDLSTYVVRASQVEEATLRSAFTVNALLALGLSAATLVASFAGAAFLGEPAVAQALRLLAIGPLLAILEFRPVAMLQREGRFKLISVVSIGKTVASAGVTIAAAFSGASYMSLAYGFIAYAGFGAVAYSLLAREYVGFRLSFDGWKRMGGFGLRMMSISGLATLANRLGDILVGRLLGLAVLGLFSRATGIATLIFQNIYGTATRVVFVKLAVDYREKGTMHDSFLQGLQMITAVMWPLLIGLALLTKPVILLMFGAPWLGAAVPLSLLLIAQFIVVGFGMNWELFVIRDELALQTRYEAIRAVASLILLVIGCMISLNAAAASRIAEALVGFLLYSRHIGRLAGTERGDLPRLYAQSGLLTLLAVLPAGILMNRSGWAADTPRSSIGLAIVIGVALWLLGLWLMRHPLSREIGTICAGLRRRVLPLR